MTERERLIKLIDDGCFEACSESVKSDKPINEVLADYLFANGVIVSPCKLGDKVYEIINPFQTKPYIITSTVCAVHITDGSKNSCNHTRENYFLAERPYSKYVKKYPFSKIGKTIFFTYEEAEKAGLEMKGERL